MSIPKSANVTTAISHFSNQDLSCQHVTTSNFMEFGVAKCMELVPKQSIDIYLNSFARLSPLAQPTFGNGDIHNRAFFVPFRTVMKGWNEFITDTTVVDSRGNPIIPVVPTIYNDTFIRFLSSNQCSSLVTNNGAFDIQVYDSQGTATQRRFTNYGRLCYKILCSLGYRVSFDMRSPFMHSALPLLCLMRVYFDWYFPSAYVDDARANSIIRWFSTDPTDDIVDFPDSFDPQNLGEVFDVITEVCYDSDYFVSAWDNPVAPNGSAFSPINVSDPTTFSEGASVTTFTDGTPVVNLETAGTNVISQYAVDALKAVSDFMRRNQISGARVLDRYLTRFGIKLESAKLDRSLLLGNSSSKIRFGDVTSTADTDGAPLGSYAGKGIIDEEKDLVSFTTDEFGMLIVISTIVPKTAYYQGQDRCTFHIDRFDFYTPEMDNLGVQALATRELFVPTLGLSQADESTGINYNDAVFGFVPRYAEYKRGYDNMTGDLVLPSKNTGKEGWTLMRDVSGIFDYNSYDEVVHSESFMLGRDSRQYNRIFHDTTNDFDKFYVIHNFVIKSRFPGRSLYDSYEFKNENEAPKVAIDINGVRAN